MTTQASEQSTKKRPDPDPLESSLLGFSVSNILAYRWRLLLIAILGFGAGAGGSFLLTPRFRANAKLASPPTSTRSQLGSLGSLGSLAGAIGISVGGSQYSPEFLASALRGRDVVDSVLALPLTAMQLPDSGRSVALYITDTDSMTPRRLESARERFQQRLTVDLDVRSGILTVSFWDHEPTFAAAMLDTLIARVNLQLIRFQRHFAEARRDYLATRVAASQGDLAERERALAAFHEQNRVINGPILQLQADRLTRRVDMSLAVFQALQRQLDEVELEVRSEIPQLMVVEHPVVPARKWFPPRRLLALLGAIVPCSVWVLLKAWRDARRPTFPPGDAPRNTA